jgi:hypothetical protein
MRILFSSLSIFLCVSFLFVPFIACDELELRENYEVSPSSGLSSSVDSQFSVLLDRLLAHQSLLASLSERFRSSSLARSALLNKTLENLQKLEKLHKEIQEIQGKTENQEENKEAKNALEQVESTVIHSESVDQSVEAVGIVDEVLEESVVFPLKTIIDNSQTIQSDSKQFISSSNEIASDELSTLITSEERDSSQDSTIIPVIDQHEVQVVHTDEALLEHQINEENHSESSQSESFDQSTQGLSVDSASSLAVDSDQNTVIETENNQLNQLIPDSIPVESNSEEVSHSSDATVNPSEPVIDYKQAIPEIVSDSIVQSEADQQSIPQPDSIPQPESVQHIEIVSESLTPSAPSQSPPEPEKAPSYFFF